MHFWKEVCKFVTFFTSIISFRKFCNSTVQLSTAFSKVALLLLVYIIKLLNIFIKHLSIAILQEGICVECVVNLPANTFIMEEKFVLAVELFSEGRYKTNTIRFLLAPSPKTAP